MPDFNSQFKVVFNVARERSDYKKMLNICTCTRRADIVLDETDMATVTVKCLTVGSKHNELKSV